MRKVLLAAAITLVLFAAVTAAFLWHRRTTRPAGPSQAQGPRSAAPGAARAEEPPPPLPGISLQIGRQHELLTYHGTPLIFSVRLANPRAMNAEAENQANQAFAERIEAAGKNGEMPSDLAEPELARLRQPVPVRSVELGDQTTGWEQFIRFEELR